MTYGELYDLAKGRLALAGNESANFDIFCLMSKSFGISRSDFILTKDKEADAKEIPSFLSDLTKRESGYPLQYVLGEWEFMGLPFYVGEGVLIPRPETELLVEFALDKIDKAGGPVIYDLCSGTGCIAISVALNRPNATIYAVETSDSASEFLNKNIKRLSANNVNAVKSDVLKGPGILGLPKPDVILCNPPYIKTQELPGLQKEVQFEPSVALDGGIDGLIFYKLINKRWFKTLNDGGFAAFECGYDQAEEIVNIFAKDSETKFEIIPDYAGINRFVCFWK